jgi:predicted  nucleic acid-binding Zn-ribbon protein
MPHQCTDCGRSFDDGSTEMLSGCPDCNGTTFQYRPEGTDGPPVGEEGSEPPDPPDSPVEGSVARTVGNAATAVRDLVGSGPTPPEGSEREAPGTRSGRAEMGDPGEGTHEDAAQASARSDVVPPEDLPPASESAATTDRSIPAGETESPAGPDRSGGEDGSATPDRPDLRTLREELNDQFESIRVLEPGQYELNLMELYDREEYIIALQEDGKYTIQVPDRWREE